MNKQWFIGIKGHFRASASKTDNKDYKFIPLRGSAFYCGIFLSVLVDRQRGIWISGPGQKEILAEFRIDESEVIMAKLNLDKLKNLACFPGPSSRFPMISFPVQRDISLIVDEAMRYQTLIDTIRSVMD